MNINISLRAFNFSVIFFFFSVVVASAKPTVVINPCDLINNKEADELMGEKMKPGKFSEQKATGMKMCLYEARNENSFAMLQISIIQGENAKENFSIMKENFINHESVEGIGQDAFIATPGIHIIENNCYVTIAAGNLKKNKDKVIVAGKRTIVNLKTVLK